MILGIGHDVTEIVRVKSILSGNIAERFLQRVLAVKELEYARSRFGRECDDKTIMWSKRWIEFTAGRFAAKEAVVKALGCGIGSLVGFQDIAILPDGAGKPVCNVSQEALRRLGLSHEVRIHVSITHTEELASAFAVVERL